jgi:outer membrane protein assembly factor BamB
MRLSLAGALAAVLLAGCRSPTLIDVSVSTDIACPRVTGTAFTSGTLGEIESLPATSASHECANGRIGSIVLVPSGGDQNALVGFKVVAAINGESVDDCVPDAGSYGPNCIVARRALRYIPHTSLTVDVVMSGACAGIACDAESTCVAGSCVPATIGNPSQCAGNGCGEGVLGPGDGGAPNATVRDAAVEASAPTVVACDTRGLLAGAAWPMEGYCPSGRGRSPLVGPHQQPRLAWSVSLQGGVASSPSVGPDGTVYISTLGGVVLALQPGDGGVQWTNLPFGDAGAIWTMPVLAADETIRVFDFTQPGGYAVFALDGGVLLNVAAPPIRSGVTMVADGTLFAVDTFGALDAFRNGGMLSQVTDVGQDFTRPSVASNGTIFSNDNVGDVFAVLDGGEAWRRSLDAGSAGTSTPQIAPDGTLRVLSFNDALYALDSSSGAVLWSQQVLAGGGDLHGMAIADDGTTYLGTSAGLYAYDSKGGPVGNRANINVGAPSIDAEGYVYAAADGVALAAFDPACNLKWQLALPSVPGGGTVTDSPVIGPGGMVYVTIDNGGGTALLVAFGP